MMPHKGFHLVIMEVVGQDSLLKLFSGPETIAILFPVNQIRIT